MRTTLPSLIALLLWGGDAAAQALTLTCEGISTKRGETTSTASGYNSAGFSANVTATTPYVRDIDSSLQVEVDGSTARVHLPRTLVPPINSGGQNGWWQLTELTVDDKLISGRVRINPFNKPLVEISRISGEVTLSGLGNTNFHGRCAKVDADQRQF